MRPRSCVARGCLDFDVWSVQIGSVPLRRDAVVELGFDESLPMIEDWGLYVRKKHRPTTSRVTTPQSDREPLHRLGKDGALIAYRRESLWQCMDTLRDKKLLQSLWRRGDPPWKVWE